MVVAKKKEPAKTVVPASPAVHGTKKFDAYNPEFRKRR